MPGRAFSLQGWGMGTRARAKAWALQGKEARSHKDTLSSSDTPLHADALRETVAQRNDDTSVCIPVHNQLVSHTQPLGAIDTNSRRKETKTNSGKTR